MWLRAQNCQYLDCFDPLLKNHLIYYNFDAILSSLDNLLKDAYVFQNGVDHFQIEHKKHAKFWLGVQYPLKYRFPFPYFYFIYFTLKSPSVTQS